MKSMHGLIKAKRIDYLITRLETYRLQEKGWKGKVREKGRGKSGR
jgi:hypothetical protein